jgi:TPR repeat protein
MLGTIYLTGQGVTIDVSEAEHWWRMAAEQGYAAAQYNLGGMYSRKISKTLDREEALDWLGRAAEQGHRSAARELAELQATVAAAALKTSSEAAAAEQPARTTL